MAEPGHDPTTVSAKRSQRGFAAVLRENWMLVLAVIVFALLSTKMLNRGTTEDAAISSTSTTPVPTLASSPDGWCELSNGVVVPDGALVGDGRCIDGQLVKQ